MTAKTESEKQAMEFQQIAQDAVNEALGLAGLPALKKPVRVTVIDEGGEDAGTGEEG